MLFCDRLLAPARTPRSTSGSTAPVRRSSSLVSAIVGFDKPFFEESRRIFTIEPAKTARSRRVQSGDRCRLAGQRQLIVSDGTQTPMPALFDKPSLPVTPFQNMSAT